MAQPGAQGNNPNGPGGLGPEVDVSGRRMPTHAPGEPSAPTIGPPRVPSSLGAPSPEDYNAGQSLYGGTVTDARAARAQARMSGQNAKVAISQDAKAGTNYTSIDTESLKQALKEAVEEGMKAAQGGGPQAGGHRFIGAPRVRGMSGVPQISTMYGAGGGGRDSGGYDEGTIGPRAGRRYQIGNVADDVTTAVGRRISQAGRQTWAPPIVETPETYNIATRQRTTFAKRVPATGPLATPGSYENQPVAPEEAQKLQRRGKALDAVKGAMTGIGSEEGLLGGISAALPEAAGMLGAAAAIPGLAIEGYDIAGRERSKNAYYQSVLGGSNAAGFGQRAQERAFQFGQMGVLGSGASRQLFQGVTSMGMQGGERQKAIDFGAEEFKSIGMSIKDTLEVISTAAKSGNSELVGVAAALKEVTNQARAAGVNANVARSNFTQTYGAVASTVVGTQAPGIAAGLAGAQTALGREFQGANLNAGFTSTMGQRLIAGQSGQSLSQFLGSSRGIGGAARYNEAVAKSVFQLLSSGGFVQKMLPIIQAHIDKAKAKNRKPTQAEFDQMGTEVLNANVIDPQGLQMAIQTLYPGTQLDLNQAVNFAVQAIVGQMSSNSGWNPAQATKDAQANAAGQTLSLSKQQKAEMTAGGLGQVTGAIAGTATATSKGMSGSDIVASVGGGQGGSPFWAGGNTKRRYQDRKDYLNQVTKSGQTNPILAALLKDHDSKDALFKVKVAGGTKVVNMRDLEQHFGDQVAAGDVEIVSGGDAGKTVAEATGMTPADNSVQNALTGKNASATNADLGKATKDRSKDVGKGSSGGVIRIDMTPELKRYLQVIPIAGNLTLNNSTDNLITPPSTVAPDARSGTINQ